MLTAFTLNFQEKIGVKLLHTRQHVSKLSMIVGFLKIIHALESLSVEFPAAWGE
jgi:hypothetical protein